MPKRIAKPKRPKPAVGWREWVAMPELGIDAIKAKVDTGAATSSLHAFKVKPFVESGVDYVRFLVHPLQRKSEPTIECVCKVHEWRKVRSSSGHANKRPVILTEIVIADVAYAVELTLANRDQMGFRMLIGREALRRRFVVDVGRSFVGGKPSSSSSPSP